MSVRRGSAVIIDVPNDNPNEPERSKRRKGIVIDVDTSGIATVAYATKVKRESDAARVGPATRGIGRALKIEYDSYFNGDFIRVHSSQLIHVCGVKDELLSSVFSLVSRKLAGS